MICRQSFKLFVALLLASRLLVSVLHAKNVSAKQEELVLLNWPDYIDKSLLQEFEQKFHIKIKEVNFETGDGRTEMLLAAQGMGYDVIVVSGNVILPYTASDWIEPLVKEKLPNLRHIGAKWQADPTASRYGVPYLWGTVGIAYRKDLVKKAVSSWYDLLSPDDSLRQKIVMIREAADTVAIAIKAQKKSVSDTSDEVLKQAEQILLKQKPFVKDYSYLTLDENSSLVKGDIWMAMLYNGDALTLKALQPQIEFVVPSEGTLIWIDYLAVMKKSQHKDLALKFINFMTEPQNAARNAMTLNFATPNQAALAFISKDRLTNPIIYPSDDILQKSEAHVPLSPRDVKKRNSIFAKLKN